MKQPLGIMTALALVASAAAHVAAEPSPTIAQVRVARATPRLERVLEFYRDGLGLPVLGGFEGHAGYDGVMLGMPGADRHLEFTRDDGRHAPPEPGPESLIVLYYPDVAERDRVVARLAHMGYAAVPPANPYWIGKAITVPDPDGFRVVLFGGRWDPSAAAVPERFLRQAR
jgi:catechol 2,3-dioxygenase-like lactoylglutathione lyase family enzyme